MKFNDMVNKQRNKSVKKAYSGETEAFEFEIWEDNGFWTVSVYILGEHQKSITFDNGEDAQGLIDDCAELVRNKLNEWE